MMKRRTLILIVIMVLIMLTVVSCNKKKEDDFQLILDQEEVGKDVIQSPEATTSPWDTAGKQPSEYTWEEYDALSDEEKREFFMSFDNEDGFDKWLENAQQNAHMPWENGGKAIAEYTWEEFEALTGLQQERFFESFASAEDFEAWMYKAQGKNATDELNAIGKPSEEFTFDEYTSLSDAAKEEFYQSFEDELKFEAWLQNAQQDEYMPWIGEGKSPASYTWEDYEKLTDIQKEMFFESFEEAEDFEDWFNKARKDDKKNPWDNGGKQPSEYTWEEYDALTEEEKVEFFRSFKEVQDYDDWLAKAQQEAYMPWKDGGKPANTFTWEEYEDLSDLQKEMFFESFSTVEAFEAWLEANQPKE